MADGDDFDARGIALEGAHCLGRMVQDDGTFLYAYDADTREPVREYDLIRHSAACWTIGCVQNALGGLDAECDAAARAMAWLVDKHTHWAGKTRCVVQADSIFLGANALAVLALVELAKDGEAGAQNLEKAKQYADFILACRQKDGDFIHRIDVREVEVDPWRSRYYTGQALLALARCTQATSEPIYLDTALEMIDGFDRQGYGVAARSHWMSYALSTLHQSTGETRLVDYAGRIARSIIDDTSYHLGGWSTALSCRAEALTAYGDILVRTQGRTSGPNAEEVMAALRDDLARLVRYRLDDGTFFMGDQDRRVQIDTIQHATAGYLGYERIDALLRA